MRIHRIILGILLAISMISSASGSAFSQGRMAGAISFTICSPDGTHDIHIGADGKPVPAEHDSSGCCLLSLDLSAVDPFRPLYQQRQPQIVAPTRAIEWSGGNRALATARGPPH